MHIENMKAIEEVLASKIRSEFDKGIECIDAEEMGTVIDMLKDIESAIYHATITQAMDEYGESDAESDYYSRRYYDDYRYTNGRFASKGHGTWRGYEEPYYHRMTPEQYRDMDKESYNRMYYTEPDHDQNHGESSYERGKRMYTESKAIHSDGTAESKQARMKDLEAYMKELSSDISGIIADMSPEEKQLMKQKLSALTAKV